MVSGQKLQLKASIIGEATNKKLDWFISLSDQSYASVSERGLVTAKRVLDKHSVTVYVRSGDTGDAEASIELQIIPVTDKLLISLNEELVGGKTITCDLNAADQVLTLTAEAIPFDAVPCVSWALTDKAGIATLTVNPDGTVTLMPSGIGKTGTVKLTATAMDGSRQKTQLSVSFVRYPHAVTILDCPEELISGQSVTLMTDVGAEKTFTDNTILWHLREEDEGYAFINPKGKLTVRAIAEQKEIEVTAEVLTTGVLSASKQITLYPKATSVSLYYNSEPVNGKQIGIETGAVLNLQAMVKPSDAVNLLKWTTSNKKIATVDENGIVTALGKGAATITCTEMDGSKKTASVKLNVCRLVERIDIDCDMSLTQTEDVYELNSGSSLQLFAKVYPEDATYKTVTWELSGEGAPYVTISKNGKLTLSKELYENYPLTVTARAVDGSNITASCSITLKPRSGEVLKIMRDGINVTGTSLALEIGSTIQFYAENVEGQDFPLATWKSSNAKVASINENGFLVVKLAGTTVVSATVGRFTAIVTINVCTNAHGIVIKVSKGGAPEVAVGKSITLTASALNPNAGKKSFTWKLADASDAVYASIDNNGKLTAKAKTWTDDTVRSVSVIATITDGSNLESAPFEIIIRPLAERIVIQDVKGAVSERAYDIGRGHPSSFYLYAKVYPETASQAVTWKSSNNKTAVIDANGLVTIKMPGKVTFMATTADGSNLSEKTLFDIHETVYPVALKITSPEKDLILKSSGESKILKCEFDQSVKPTNKAVKWSIPKPYWNFVTIDEMSGKVTAAKLDNEFDEIQIPVHVTADADPLVTAATYVTLRSVSAAERAEHERCNALKVKTAILRDASDNEFLKVQKQLARWTADKKKKVSGICNFCAHVTLMNRYIAYYYGDTGCPFTAANVYKTMAGDSPLEIDSKTARVYTDVNSDKFKSTTFSCKVNGKTVKLKSVEDSKPKTEADLVSILEKHPEGVWVRFSSKEGSESSGHVVVVVGYEYENGKYTFQVADSNGATYRTLDKAILWKKRYGGSEKKPLPWKYINTVRYITTA